MAAGAAGHTPDEAQCRAIKEIVEAVRGRQHWRAGVLLEQFVVSADLTALVAMRTRLRELDTSWDP
ncbi:hypothetical protein [Streptomyces pseudovenezuelae]|uniref:Uncharacterized protein n=1 Tax=Streptomyces pseudovenezuelae TaxID=67350 RepID=A0ABT6M2S5_9ACTN|nr:hypothetical protein [Streptomyces pseudovenezuelae]MDH6222857.1 hypothetical protein [Streptomyces pseudovenezuelae]